MKKLCFLILLGFLAGCGGGGGEEAYIVPGVPTPIVKTLAPTLVPPTAAVLNGTVIPNGLQTECWFEYGRDPGLGTYIASPTQDAGAGMDIQTVNMTLNNLAATTTYYYRFSASNGNGASKGAIYHFTTSSLGAAPIASVGSADNTSQSGARLKGHVVPNGFETDAWFEYGTDSSLATFDNTAREPIGYGMDNVPVDASITGLEAETKYYFRVGSSNAKGTAKSAIANFTTSSVVPAPPVAATVAATSVTSTTATLNGNVTPNSLATTAWFEYGTSSTLATYTSTSSESVGSGTTSVAVDVSIAGLTLGQGIYFRVAATNSSGTTRGSILSFTPGARPTVTNLAATSVGANTAVLNGNVTPNGLATSVRFEYGTSSTLSTYTSTTTFSVGSGTVSVPVHTTLMGLTTGATYYYRVVAWNSSGTIRGTPILNFIANGAPIATAGVADNTSQTGATLRGYVIPNGLETSAWFIYGTDPALATYDNTAAVSIGSGADNVLVDAAITGLAAGTTYYFRVSASNSKGDVQSDIASFTSSDVTGPPVVATVAASSVGATTATLNSSVDPNGLETNAWFEYGTDSGLAAYDNTSTVSVGAGTAGVPVTVVMTGLTSGTTYYFRAAGGNSSGETRGSILSFIPGAAPTVATLAATSIGATTASLNGNVNPNGLATNAWFEYGTDSGLSTYTSTLSEAVGAGTAGMAFGAELTGLTTGTTYYYRVAAGSSSGTTLGEILSFTPGGAPSATTTAATALGATTATLNGTVNPNGLATDAWFEYGTDPGLSTYASTLSVPIGSGAVGVPIGSALSGLTTGTTYYFRVAGSNSSGTTRGDILNFVP